MRTNFIAAFTAAVTAFICIGIAHSQSNVAPLPRARMFTPDLNDLPRAVAPSFDLNTMSEEQTEALQDGFKGKIIGGNVVYATEILPERNVVVVSPAADIDVTQVSADGFAHIITRDATGQLINAPLAVVAGSGMGQGVDVQSLSDLAAAHGSVRITILIDRSGSMAGQAFEAVKTALGSSLSALPVSPSIMCKVVFFNDDPLVVNAGQNGGWSSCSASNFDLSGIEAEGGTRPGPVILDALREQAQPVMGNGDLGGVIVMTDGHNLSAAEAAQFGGFSTPIMTYFAGEADYAVYPDISKTYLDHSDTESAEDAFRAFLGQYVFARIVDLNKVSVLTDTTP